ncbi:MAG TPA: hypothetical protein VMZ90_11820 [Vicinamibacterales bacterium]|nr:hypothetical protein [Vicinamibacterales bacterium]
MPKLNIRLPEDDHHGPNPYDSKTPLIHQSPRWLWDWEWWITGIVSGTVMAISHMHRAGTWPF